MALAHLGLGVAALWRKLVYGSIGAIVGSTVVYCEYSTELQVLDWFYLQIDISIERTASAAVVAVHHHVAVRVAVIDIPVGTYRRVVVAVGIIYGYDGRCRERTAQIVVVDVARVHATAVLVHKTDVLADGNQAVEHLVLRVGTQVIPLIIRYVGTANKTVLPCIASRDRISGDLAATGKCQAVACGQGTVVYSLVYPVGVVHVAVGITDGAERSPVYGRHARVEASLVHDLHVLGRVEHVELAGKCLPANISVVGNLAGTFFSALGGNENHTVGSLRTVDGSRGCILQHVDALDIGRVEGGDVTGHTVDKVERL